MKTKLLALLLLVAIFTTMLCSCEGLRFVNNVLDFVPKPNNNNNNFDIDFNFGDNHVHTEGILPAVESTCTTHGLTEGRYCTSCKETLVEQKQAPLKPHTEGVLPAVESTCSEHGLTEGRYCIYCKEPLVEQKQAPLKAHTFDDDRDATCNNCSYVRDITCLHTNIEILEAKESTCAQTGLTEGKKCKDCELILVAQQLTGLKDHTTSDWIIDQEGTLSKDGLRHTECTVCSVILKIETWRPTEPIYSEWSEWSEWTFEIRETSDVVKQESATLWSYYYCKCPSCGAHMHVWNLTCPTWAGGCGKAYIPESSWVWVFSEKSYAETSPKDWYGTTKYYTYLNGQLVFQGNGQQTVYRYATRKILNE